MSIILIVALPAIVAPFSALILILPILAITPASSHVFRGSVLMAPMLSLMFGFVSVPALLAINAVCFYFMRLSLSAYWISRILFCACALLHTAALAVTFGFDWGGLGG